MTTVQRLLAEARATLPHRPSPSEALAAQRAGAVLIDIRGDDQRRKDGLIPGAINLARNALEWRCDPASGWRLPIIDGYEQHLILVCDQGFQSSLAAANLQRLGLRHATDMDGGFAAYRAAGLPIDHSNSRLRAGETGRARHWDTVYGAKASEQLSWYQAHPAMSLALVDALGVPRDAAVIDVGGGSSGLAESLLERGFSDVTVLDVSASALRCLSTRLGPAARRVQMVRADLLRWTPPRRYELWHDRALLHFLVDPVQRARYIEILDSALMPGGTLIIGVFAPDGPDHCSGLPVMRYGTAQLAELLGTAFQLTEERREEHVTPAGSVQPFTWVAFCHAS